MTSNKVRKSLNRDLKIRIKVMKIFFMRKKIIKTTISLMQIFNRRLPTCVLMTKPLVLLGYRALMSLEVMIKIRNKIQ